MRIADAISTRPRTLSELADLTGISVQGVLKHLRRLAELGLVEERKVPARAARARRVYLGRQSFVGDYSTRDLKVVKLTEQKAVERGKAGVQDLESFAGDLLLRRRRIGEQVRNLAKSIDELVEEEAKLVAALEARPLSDEERLILLALLTEETVEDGAKVLSRYYGLGDRRSIDRALSKVRRIVSK